MKALVKATLLAMLMMSCRPASFQTTDKGNDSDLRGNGASNGSTQIPNDDDANAMKPSPVAMPEPMSAPAPAPAPAPVPMPVEMPAMEPAPTPAPQMKPILVVTVPSPEIKAGKEKMPAKAVIKDGDQNPKVTWEIKGPMNIDLGTIDTNGVYTSPEKSKDPFDIEIVAVLVDDPSVTGSTKVKVIPKEEIFARCTKGNMIFPIVADVYALPVNTANLPNFNTLQKVTTVCMDKYAVAQRDFSTGFPDVPNLFEWFGLKTTTTLIVPQDGVYTFRLNSDDGAKLWIDDKLAIDNDGLHEPFAKEAVLTLTKGEHKLNLDYFQGPRFLIALELFWKKPGSANLEIVPRENFK